MRRLANDRPETGARFCRMQLGRAAEQMLLQIHGKLTLRKRLPMIELRLARNGQRIAK